MAKSIKSLTTKMIKADEKRDLMFEGMDKMFRSEWSLPEALKAQDWIRRIVSTDPHDAIRAGTRVLSRLDERIEYQPLSETVEAKKDAARIEKALKWFLANASRRRRAAIRRDVVMSALRYDEICAQIIYLPHHIKQIKELSGASVRYDAAKRYGPFAIVMRPPRNVHTRYSDFMPESVVYASILPAEEVVDLWGKAAGAIEKKIKDSDEQLYVSLFDYTDLETRMVWGAVGNRPVLEDPEDKNAITIIDEADHGLPFLPWVCRVGGTTLETSAQHQRIPLLYSIYQAEQWLTQNVMETVVFSEAIARSAAPRIAISGPSPEQVEVDYGDPAKILEVPPGHEVAQLRPPDIDRALLELEGFMRGAIQKSTVASILQGGDIPSGTAYATLNLATLTALGTLKPYQEIAELALADICTQMLQWIHFSGEEATAYGRDRDGSYVYKISPDEIDPDNVYLSVQLEPDVPSDRMQRINAASIAVQNLDMSKESAMKDIGITDPQGEMKRRRLEILLEARFQQRLAEEAAEAQLRLQAKAAQMAQAPQGQQPPGFPMAGGQGFNPAQGGSPPAELFPGGTREGQTGQTQGGEEAAFIG